MEKKNSISFNLRLINMMKMNILKYWLKSIQFDSRITSKKLLYVSTIDCHIFHF